MKITGSLHLTATEKRHIKQLIENGWTQGGTKRKFYRLEKTDCGFSGKVETPETDMMGRRIVRTQRFEVSI
jgi:hypothetical protein